ncbi:MAG: alpha/beta hydrolase [Dehalococcoidia bacterium]
MIRRLVLLASVLSVVPLGVAWAISQRVLHPPRKQEDHDLNDFDLPAKDVTFFSSDGTRLSGWFIPAPGVGPSPAVVLSHGWSRSRCELLPHADILHRAGFAVLMFDYRHRGESGGAAITMGLRERDDLSAAIDTLASRPEVDPARVGVFGMSMGSVVAILVAAEDQRVRALTVEAPYSSQDTLMTRSLQHYFKLPTLGIGAVAKRVIDLRLGEPLALANARDAVQSHSPRPVYVIADEHDAVVGCDETERVFEAALEPKRFWLIPGADHARGWQAAPEEYERRLVAFFRDTLARQREPLAVTSDASAGNR